MFQAAEVFQIREEEAEQRNFTVVDQRLLFLQFARRYWFHDPDDPFAVSRAGSYRKCSCLVNPNRALGNSKVITF